MRGAAVAQPSKAALPVKRRINRCITSKRHSANVSACWQCQRQRGLVSAHPRRRTLGPMYAENPLEERKLVADDPKEEAPSISGRPSEEEVEPEESAGVRAALGMLRFYKDAISPLLQPACRFQPTCSAYAMDAYKKFGVGKGTALTAWRLMRCNPWGGSGYDPVKWPPPGLEWAIKDQSS